VRFTLQKGNAASVIALIERGLDVDAPDAEGRTPLMVAAGAGNSAACKALLGAGADPTRIDSTGRDAMGLASEGRKTDAFLVVAEAVRVFSALAARSSSSKSSVISDECPTAPDVEPEPEIISSNQSGLRLDDSAPVLAADATSDASAWIDLEPPDRPPDNVESLRSFATSQAVVSGAEVVGAGADWSDVEANLPTPVRKRKSVTVPSPLDAEMRVDIGSLIVRALSEGRVQEAEISETLARLTDEEAKERAFEAIVTVLGDLGSFVDDDISSATDCQNSEEPALSDRVEVDEAVSIVVETSKPVTRAWECYQSDVLEHKLLDAAEELLVAHRIKRGRSDALAIIARSPTAVTAIAQWARRAIADRIGMELFLAPEDGESHSDMGSVEGDRTGTTESKLTERFEQWSARLSGMLPALADRGGGAVPPGAARDVRSLLEEASLQFELIERTVELIGRDDIEQGLLDALGLHLKRVVDARNRMVACNQRLVVHLARRYARSGMDLEDLVQEGNLGLMRAVERFDPDRGNRFATYAGWWIRQAMSRAVADKSRTIRVPVHVGEKLRRLERFQEQELRPTELTVAEIASALEVEDLAVEKLLKVPAEPVSLSDLDEIALIGQESWMYAFPETPEDSLAARQMRRVVQDAVKRLPQRAATVIALRFGFGEDGERTLEEVGTIYGVTRERIRQIEAKALAALSHPSRATALARLL
jgi:RNA polymerase primary sigma factor